MYEIKQCDSILVSIFYGHVSKPEIQRFSQTLKDILKENKDLFVIAMPIYMENIGNFDEILDKIVSLHSEKPLIKRIYSLSPESKPNLITQLFWTSKNDRVELRKTTTVDKLFRKIEADGTKYPSLKKSYDSFIQEIHRFIYQTEQKASLLPLCMNDL